MLVDVWDEKKFQFTHPGGVRHQQTGRRIEIIKFQFTHPGGVRQVDNPSNSTETCFNSRTREGCDLSSCQ